MRASLLNPAYHNGSQRELAMARSRLSEIRRLHREGTQEPTWTNSLTIPLAALGSMTAVICYVFTVLK